MWICDWSCFKTLLCINWHIYRWRHNLSSGKKDFFFSYIDAFYMCTSQNEEIRLNKDNKILSRTKLEAFAEHNFSVVQIMIYGLDWVENILGNGENAGYQHFLLFPQCFQKSSSWRSLKAGTLWLRVYIIYDIKAKHKIWAKEQFLHITLFLINVCRESYQLENKTT